MLVRLAVALSRRRMVAYFLVSYRWSCEPRSHNFTACAEKNTQVFKQS
jgi:hypothetical protein